MPTVWIPALLRHLTHDQESIEVPGETLRALIDALEARYPGIKARLLQGDDLRPGLAVVVDTQVVRGGLTEAVSENSEVHFIPAIGGGAHRP
jgi:molybdopterin synthase sulfur carrier subunit